LVSGFGDGEYAWIVIPYDTSYNIYDESATLFFTVNSAAASSSSTLSTQSSRFSSATQTATSTAKVNVDKNVKVIDMANEPYKDCAPCGAFNPESLAKYSELPENEANLINKRFAHQPVGQLFIAPSEVQAK